MRRVAMDASGDLDLEDHARRQHVAQRCGLGARRQRGNDEGDPRLASRAAVGDLDAGDGERDTGHGRRSDDAVAGADGAVEDLAGDRGAAAGDLSQPGDSESCQR